MSGLEIEYRAAMLAEPEKKPEIGGDTSADAEQCERIELRNRVQVRRYLSAAMMGKFPDGAESEYSAGKRGERRRDTP